MMDMPISPAVLFHGRFVFRFAARFLCWSVCWAVPALAMVQLKAQNMEAVPGVVVGYEPSPSWWDRLVGNVRYTASPSIVVLPNGNYLIAHNIFGGGSGAGLSGETRLYRSSDQGETWTRLPNVMDMKRGSLFVHQGVLYLWGYRTDNSRDDVNGDILIRRSDDNGDTWTTPLNASNGLLREGRFGGTPFNPVVHGGRLWLAQSGTRVMSAPANSNLLAASSWTLSNGANVQSGPLGSGLTITEAQIFASTRSGVVIMPKVGGLPNSVIIRASANPAIIVHPGVNDWVSLPGGDKKFGGAYDPVSDRYYILSNPIPAAYAGVTTPQLTRNTGALLSSRDLRHWDVEKIFIHSSNVAYEAFQYFNFEIEGEDLLVASRTAFDVGGNRPPRGHDSNLITFHRIENFRQAVPDHFLVPDPSNHRVLRWERTQHTPAPLGRFTLGHLFAGAPLHRPSKLGQDAGGDVYVEEEGGRILRFDALGNFIAVVETSPVPLHQGEISISQPAFGERTWIGSGSGNWSDIDRWFYWNRPDTPYETAIFGSALEGEGSIDVDGHFTVKGLRFRNSHRHTLEGSGQLTLRAETGHSFIESWEGDHEILVPVTLAGDTLATGNPGSSLLLLRLDLNGHELRISGGAKFLSTGRLFLRGGTVKLEAGSSLHFQGSPQPLLDGTLELVLPDGSPPAPFERLALIHGVDLFEGFFDHVTLPPLPPDLEWNTDELETDGVVTVLPTRGYGHWLTRHFTLDEILDPLLSGPSADPDGDGKPNLLEYALGTNPREAGAMAFEPEVRLIEGDGGEGYVLTMDYLQPGDVEGILFAVEATSDFQTWNPVPLVETVEVYGEGLLHRFREEIPPGAHARRFLRLRITLEDTLEP